MKTNTLLTLSLLAIFALTIGVSSCKKDDEPPPAKPLLSFTVPTVTVNEADGTIAVEASLDKPAAEDIYISYTLGGTAINRASITGNQAYDYEVLSEAGEIEILKGETTGNIDLKLTSDYFPENSETIEISIDRVDSDNIEITRDDEVEITVEQEDGLLIYLFWPEPTADSIADLDIIVRSGATIEALTTLVTASFQEGFEGPEVVFIPKAINDVAFGLSYVYYDGTMNNLPFTAVFVDLISGELEPEAGYQTFEGTYSHVNKNKWEDPATTQVVQTFKKSGGNAIDITTIDVPPSGSRLRPSVSIPYTLKKQDPTIVLSDKFRTAIKNLYKNPLQVD